MVGATYKQGFTIVELLSVIVVIGILAGISTVAYNGMQARARATAVQTEHAGLAEQIEAYTATSTYPASISSCPTPVQGSMCLPPKTGQTLAYYAFNPTAAPRFYSAYHSTVDPAYELEVRNPDTFYYASNAEIANNSGSNMEFMQYMDMAPMIDQYGLRKYKISFDIKSANTSVKNTVRVYMQNGSGARYTFYADVPVTTSYARQSVTITPTGPNAGFTQSILAFYGEYTTGNRPTVKNVVIQEG